MEKVFISLIILIGSIIGSIILCGVIFDAYPKFGTFENLFYLGLTAFGLCIALLISGYLLKSSKKQQQQ